MLPVTSTWTSTCHRTTCPAPSGSDSRSPAASIYVDELKIVQGDLSGTPTNVSPADGAMGVGLTPTLQSSAFSAPDTGTSHSASQWQVTTGDGSYVTPVYDSGTTPNLTSISLSSSVLNRSTTYYWRVRYQDNHGAWSPWSTETSFATIGLPASLTVAASSSAVAGGKSITITATLKTGDTPLAGKTVTWQVTGGGRVDPQTSATNASGQATTTYYAPQVTGTTSVNITASFAGDESAQNCANLCYVSVSPASTPNPGGGSSTDGAGNSSGGGSFPLWILGLVVAGIVVVSATVLGLKYGLRPKPEPAPAFADGVGTSIPDPPYGRVDEKAQTEQENLESAVHEVEDIIKKGMTTVVDPVILAALEIKWSQLRYVQQSHVDGTLSYARASESVAQLKHEVESLVVTPAEPAPEKTYYDILGISPTASQDEIKHAYRDKMKEYHPDKFTNAPDWVKKEAEDMTKKLNEAYEELKDSGKRQEYDKRMGL